jgi:hypothetical protein
VDADHARDAIIVFWFINLMFPLALVALINVVLVVAIMCDEEWWRL